MDLAWPYILFVVATIWTVPLHLLISIVIITGQKLTPFYALMLSQSVADVYLLLFYNFFTVLRVSQLCSDFFWNNRYFLANASYLTTYYTLYLRCIGITLISIQRYVTVCQSGTRIEMIMAETPVLFFVILHWCIALPMIAPLMTSFNVTYDAKDTMEVLVPPSSLALANMISMVSVFILFFICVFCYVFVINHILRSRFTTNVTKRHEIRLSIQFAGLMIAFLFVFIYSIGQYVLNEMREIDLLYDWRQLNPIMNGFLSCVQPWMCLFFNKEIRNKLKGIVGCRQKQNEPNQGSMFKQSTPLSRR